jgi:group I intron endonuclease
MNYIIYKTTNKINSKIYIGAHKTNNLKDNYLGSGDLLIKAIKKYGTKNFKREILKIFDNSDDMYIMEKMIVNKCFVERLDTYNLKIGGVGGWDSEPRKRFKLLMEDEEYVKCFSEKIKNGQKIYIKDPEKRKTFLNKTHNEESKKKISNSKKGTGCGKNNSQFGTMWITNNIKNKKIKKTDLIPEGWNKGRKF